MAVSNSFSRLLIVNGQPILIKEDSLNPSEGFSTDILQQAINGVTSTDALSNVIHNSNNTDIVTSDVDMNVENSTENHFITEFSSDHSSEDTIRLTVEQVSALGLHFTTDHLNESVDLNSKRGSIEDTPKPSQFIISSGATDPLSSTDCVKIECNLDTHNVSENNENSSLLDPFQTVSSEQEFTIVPHIVNGTVTYTLQLSNDIINSTQSNNDELLTINDSSMTQEPGSSDQQLRFDLTSLPDSSDLPFISSLGLVSNKITENSIQNRRSENEMSNQTFGLVSCNSENITFLTLSDTISGSNSNQTTQTTNTTPQQIKLSSKLYNPVDGKFRPKSMNKKTINQTRESLLLKHQGTTSNFQNVVRLKNKIKQVAKISSHSDCCIPPKKVSEPAESNLNASEKSEEHKCLQESRSVIETNKQNIDSLSLNGNSSSNAKGITDKRSEDSSDATTNIPTIITPQEIVGDVPENVSDALNNIPIKIDCNKPLGSTENPIKLAQQGSTFLTMQALTEDHISKIKPILQDNFDAKIGSKNVVYDPTSNTRIIYRIVSPSEVQLRKPSDCPRRRGRPRKGCIIERQSEEIEGVSPPKKLFPRTRSGRLSRPPKHMVRDYKHIRRPDADDSDGGYSDYKSDNEEVADNLDSAPVELLPGLVAKRKNHKRNISAGNLCPTCGKIYLGYVRMKRHFDKYPDHGSIEYLNTVRNSNPDSEAENHRLENGNAFWRKGPGRRKGRGKSNCFTTADKRTRLKEALEWCTPQEVADIAGPTVAGVLSLWQLLLLRVDSVKGDSRVATLYDELCQLLTTLRHMASRLFRPLDHPLPPGTKHVTVQVENEIMTELLDLPCGVYLASDEDLDKSPAPNVQEPPSTQEPQVSPSTPLIEKKPQEKSCQEPKEDMSIDDVPQPFLEEMICDSGMVNVDEIVSERLQNFTGSQSSSVDELMKGLNELEQRNKLETDDLMEGFSIVSRRNHVSASTEDLMKSLEHFESDLNHSDPPSTLDRETFDRVSNVDTLDFEVLSREFHSNNR